MYIYTVKTVVFSGHFLSQYRHFLAKSVRIGTKWCPEDTFVFTVYRCHIYMHSQCCLQVITCHINGQRSIDRYCSRLLLSQHIQSLSAQSAPLRNVVTRQHPQKTAKAVACWTVSLRQQQPCSIHKILSYTHDCFHRSTHGKNFLIQLYMYANTIHTNKCLCYKTSTMSTARTLYSYIRVIMPIAICTKTNSNLYIYSYTPFYIASVFCLTYFKGVQLNNFKQLNKSS